MEADVQRCGRCKVVKPLDSFAPSKRGTVGSWCRPCVAAYARGAAVPPAQHEPRICKFCGVEYIPKQVKASSKFCSRKCGEANRRESGREREQHLIRKYGITAADYDRILAEQNGGCALCGVTPAELTTGRYRDFLHVDHDHESGRVRGLLCPDHNLLLGRFGDRAEMFRKIVEYLENGGTDAARALVPPRDPAEP